MNDVFSTHVELTLSENLLKIIDNLTDMVFCVYCFFTAGSEAGGCVVELESEEYTSSTCSAVLEEGESCYWTVSQ